MTGQQTPLAAVPAPCRPERVGAAEARRLAASARELGATTRTSRLVLELLLRLSRGWVPVERSTPWIARQCGASPRSARRALDLLDRLDLIELVQQGRGRTRASYRVVFTRLTPAPTRVNLTVHPGEPAPNPDPSEGSVCPPRGVSLTPQRGQFDPSVRARARVQSSTRSTTPPPPSPASRPGPPEPHSPTAGGRGAPSPEHASEHAAGRARCPHGRTEAQGCRRCGTDVRSQARATRETQAAAERADRIARQLAARSPDPSLTPPPDGWRALVAAASRERPHPR